MDLQEFKSEMLYFQEPENPEIENLLAEAAANYGPESEALLLRALDLEADNLSVLIGLYRYYYYQHRYIEGIAIAHRVMNVVGGKIEFPDHWQKLTMKVMINGLQHSFCLVRLYLFALKAAGYLHLRIKNFEEGREMIEKVVMMDSNDRIGAKVLLQALDRNKARVLPINRILQAEGM